jgi:hypothetical protein
MKYLVLILSLLVITTCYSQEIRIKKSIRFSVSDVKRAAALLKTDSARKVFENKLGLKIQFAPQEHLSSKFVYSANNALIQTIQECYDEHRPLVLSPDIIWLTICQGISLHINQNFDSLKSSLFKSDSIVKIVARNDSLGSGAKHWSSLIASISDKTQEYTKEDIYELFVTDFSTTRSVEKTVSQITLLESLKQGFEYVGESGCGIPSITLNGTREDWIKIKGKLKQLDKYGLSAWANNLSPLIDEFINVYDGKINKEFWQSIYKDAVEYNAFYISGWIIKFFPYIKTLEFTETYDQENEGFRAMEKYAPNIYMEGNSYCQSTLSTDNFPTGVSRIDLTWNDHFKDQIHDLNVYGGFLAIKQNDDMSLEPLISWAICDKKDKIEMHSLTPQTTGDIKHTEDYWSPHFPKHLTNTAIYDIKKFDTQEKSLQYLKGLLLDSLAAAGLCKDSSKIQIQFIVYSNGSIDSIIVNNNRDEVLAGFIKEQILTLPMPWYPALANPMAVLRIMDFEAKKGEIKVKANSRVSFELF